MSFDINMHQDVVEKQEKYDHYTFHIKTGET